MSLSSTKSHEEGKREKEGEQKCSAASIRQDPSLKDDHRNPTVKTSNQPYLEAPLQSTWARSSDTLSDLSTYSADNGNDRRTGRLLTVSSAGRLLSSSPAPLPKTWRATFRLFWARNKGLSMVILAQLFGVIMNVTIRLLEVSGTSGPAMHPFQVRPVLSQTFLPDTLGADLTRMTDPLYPNDWDSDSQRHLSMVGQSGRSAFGITTSTWTLDCTWGGGIFRR